MPRYVASQNQYLVVQYRDGHKEHIKGLGYTVVMVCVTEKMCNLNASYPNHLIITCGCHGMIW